MMPDRYRGIVIGVLLLVGIVLPGVVVGSLNTRHERALENLRQDVKRLRAEERRVGTGSRRAQTEERIEGLQKQLQGRDQLSARLEQLHRIASGYGVRIGKAGYQLHPADAAAGGVGRYDIRLETDAAYYELRFFLRDLFAADPLLALESIELRRSAPGSYNAGGKSILATLHIVMYFGITK